MVKHLALFLMSILLFVGFHPAAFADEPDPFALGVSALHDGRIEDAIVQLESMANLGTVDAAASFNRGLAYATRARSRVSRPGDLGQAIAGLEEAKELTRDTAVKETCFATIAKLRADAARNRGEALLTPGSPVVQSLASSLSENTWFAMTCAFAILLAFLILFRRLPWVFAALLPSCFLSAAALAFSAAMLTVRIDTRIHVSHAVVVSPAARVSKEASFGATGAPIAEGSLVRVREYGADFVRITHGEMTGYVPSNTIRVLQKE